MSVAFDLDVGTFPRLQTRIAEIRRRAENLEPVIKRQAVLLSTVIDDSYQKSRSPLGEAWPSLASSTIEKRRKGSSKPLVDTGQLRVQSNARADGRKIVFGVAGAAAKYGVFHVTGTSDIPRRSPFPMDSEGNADFSSGPAAAWLDKTRNVVIDYLINGENQR